MIAACDVLQAGTGQMQGVDRRQDGADSDRAGSGSAGQQFRQAEERPQETLPDGLDVRTAFAQVRILHALELRRDPVDHMSHRAFGRDLVALDQAARALHHLVVPKHQAVGFEDEMSLVQVLRFEPRRQRRQLSVAIAPLSRSRAEALLTALKLVREEARGAFSVFQERAA